MSSQPSISRRFGVHALTYVLASALTRGLWLLLTPFYTRVMGPSDYAVVSIGNTLTSVLGILTGLALFGAIPRLYIERDPPARLRFLGTLAGFSITFSIGFGLLLEAVGWCGGLDIFPELPFHPHFELVIWTAVLSNWLTIPTQVYLAEERARRVGLINFAAALAQLLFAIVLVGVLRQSALGLLRANLAAAIVSAGAALFLLSRMTSREFSISDLRAALVFALPLIPHLVANWALAVSDRLVLARLVTSDELGRYSIGYLLATGVAMVGAALVAPINPAANRYLGDPTTASNLPILGTYALVVILGVALLVTVNAEDIVHVLAPPAYAGAAVFVPWVVVGAVFQTVYLVCSTGTWYSKKTRLVPVVTLLSVAVNVGLNLLLVPRYGIIVAAISTMLGYATAAFLHALLAQRNHPVSWEYGRWLRAAALAFGLHVLVHPIHTSIAVVSIAVKSVVTVVAFAAGLVLLRCWPKKVNP